MSETALQIEVAAWLRVWVLSPADGGPWWTAVNPVPSKSRAAAGLSKAMGMKAGVHDIIWGWRGRFGGIELKTEAGALSEAQSTIHEEFTLAGGVSIVCRSLAEVQAHAAVLGWPVRSVEERAAQLATLRLNRNRMPRLQNTSRSF